MIARVACAGLEISGVSADECIHEINNTQKHDKRIKTERQLSSVQFPYETLLCYHCTVPGAVPAEHIVS